MIKMKNELHMIQESVEVATAFSMRSREIVFINKMRITLYDDIGNRITATNLRVDVSAIESDANAIVRAIDNLARQMPKDKPKVKND